MNHKLTESIIENFAIELFQRLGYEYVYAPDIAPDSENPVRSSFEEVILTERLTKAVRRINVSLPADAVDEAIKTVLRIASPDTLANNEQFHRLLTEGVPVTIHKEGTERGERVWLIDFEYPELNDFVVANQYTIIENGHNKRPDVILFVNGLPLVVIELKMLQIPTPPYRVLIVRLRPTNRLFHRYSPITHWS